MQDSDLPNGTASSEPLTFEQGVTELEALFDPPAQPEPEEGKVQNEAEEEAEAPEGDEAESEAAQEAEETEGDDKEPDETGDEDESEESEEEGETLELSDDLEIDLGDGVTATLAALKADYGQVRKREADFQRDYTRKTQELADTRKEVDSQSQRVLQAAQQTAQERKALLQLQQALMPQPPEQPVVSIESDPIAWMEYNAAKDAYNETMAEFQALQQQEWEAHQRQAEAEQAERNRLIEENRTRLFERRPTLKDSKVAEQTFTEMYSVMKDQYGIDGAELAPFFDSRAFEVMLDAVAYQKLQQATPKAKAKLKGKPPVLKGSKQRSPQQRDAQARKAKSDRLRKSGDLTAAVDVLMDFDL